MSIATLNDIRTKVRYLTSSGTSLQLTDAQIDDFINSFYLYDLPAQFRSLKLKDVYTFTTTRGIDVYPFDSEHYTTIQAPVTCSKRQISLFYEPNLFFVSNYNIQYFENFTSGNGTVGPYSGNTQANPILRSYNNDPGPQGSPNYNYPESRVQNILITANSSFGVTQNVTDDGQGNLIQIIQDPASPQFAPTYYSISAGSIDYETGAISNLTFFQSIPDGNDIQVQYLPALVNIPLSIMFYQNQFTLRPCPDKGYTIELTAYRQPTQALVSTAAGIGVPELREWWELVAVGAAKKVFENRLDTDGVAIMDKMLFERYAVAEARTYAQLGKERIQTIFAGQLENSWGTGNWFFPSN